MLANDVTNITKKDAITIGSKSCRERIQYKTTNIASGSRASGMWVLSFPVINTRLNLFKDGVIAFSEENPTWVRFCETVGTEVMPLTPAIDIRP